MSDLTAYDLYLRANAMHFSAARQNPEALSLTEQAIERDPRYGPALGLGAVCCLRLVMDGQSDDPTEHSQKGVDLARRALEVAGDDPGILGNAALSLAYFGEDLTAAMVLIDQALALNPSFARGWHISGILSLWGGELDVALERFEAARRLSPRARIGFAALMIGTIRFLSHQFEMAVPELLVAIQDDPTYPEAYRVLAACYAHMGRLGEAQEVLKRLRAVTPIAVPSVIPYRNPEHRELYFSGLRLATGEAA